MDQIEEGLTLYDDGERKGIEFPAGRRRIDILANDKNGDLVVIELKVSRGPDRTLGQIQYYLAWVKQNIAKDSQKVRGIIIASEINEDLQMACSVTDIDLREYSISFSLKEV